MPFMTTQSFWQRLANLAFYYGSLAGEQLRALPLYQRLCGKYGVDCLSTPVAHGSTMFLYNMVHAMCLPAFALLMGIVTGSATATLKAQDWAMEWPRPLPPNVQLVGALLPTPAQPLSPAFQVRCKPSGNGVPAPAAACSCRTPAQPGPSKARV